MLHNLIGLNDTNIDMELSIRGLSKYHNVSREQKIIQLLDNELKMLYKLIQYPVTYNPYKIAQSNLGNILTPIEFASKPVIDSNALLDPIKCLNYSMISKYPTIIYISKLSNDILVKIMISLG